jgi:hypothetical protein
LARWNNIPYSLTRLSMDYNLPAYFGIRDLQMLSFSPCKTEQDYCMREADVLHKYIGVYLFDLLIAAKDP